MALDGDDFLVHVRSSARPDLTSTGRVNRKVENIHLRVMATAGAIAERQCAMYMDRHNPDEVAREAGEEFVNFIQRMRAGA